MKGLILKIENNEAYIMNNDGSFKTIPALSNWQVGQVVSLKQKSAVINNIKRVASIAACFILLVVGGLYLWNEPVAYVDVAVNPNVELVSNRFDRIISVDGLNDDGKKLIENASIKGLTVNEAYLKLLDLLNWSGYLSKIDAKINLDVSHNNESARVKLQNLLTDLTNGFISQHSLGCGFDSNAMPIPDYMDIHHGNGSEHKKKPKHNEGNSSAPPNTHKNDNEHGRHDNEYNTTPSSSHKPEDKNENHNEAPKQEHNEVPASNHNIETPKSTSSNNHKSNDKESVAQHNETPTVNQEEETQKANTSPTVSNNDSHDSGHKSDKHD